ncbi:MAG: gamma-glutamyltransferase, partial [Myxococcota bacterium]
VDVLTRLTETRRVYLPEGRIPVEGTVFRQPALATTLREVASAGADYMYEGAWAERFVDQVSAEGGRVTLEDLASYEAVWAEPICFEYAANTLCTLGARDAGGIALGESMLVANEVRLRDRGGYLDTPDAVYWLLRSQQTGSLMTYLPWLLPKDPTFANDRLAGVEPSVAARMSRAQAAAIVEHIETGRFDAMLREWGEAYESSSHSDGVVVIDGQGNVVALTHTINTSRWGTTGLNVDGVSVPDSASFQQGAVHLAGPGGYLPSILNPTIVSDEERVNLAATTIGHPHFAMFSHLHGILDHGFTVEEMVTSPIIDGTGPFEEFIPPGAVDARVVDAVRARGLPIRTENGRQRSFWLGAQWNAAAEQWDGAVTPSLRAVGGGRYTPLTE